ncbi:glycosyltransferase family 2 protein [Pantoea sp. FN060301]|uniref:glycosyltransferase family 2 protein n=1 Tax=Pantoea sp. FN060301 TaxID=3420380 RepID=UPI003D1632B5
MNSILLSVIIPAFNVREYIIECIDSLTEQVSIPYEIIVVNDGSTDGTGTLVEQHYAANDSVTVITTQNQGAGLARDTGIAAAKGDYLFFCDPDDIVCEGMFSEFSDVINAHPETDLFCFNSITFVEEQPERTQFKVRHTLSGLTQAREVLSSLLANGRYTSAAWNYIVRKALVIKHQLSFHDRVHEDHCFTLGAFLHAGQAWVSKETYYRQRIRNGSLTNSHKPDHYFQARYDAFTQSLDVLSANTDNSPLSQRIRRNYLLHSFRLMIYISMYNRTDVPPPVIDAIRVLGRNIRPENLKERLLLRHPKQFILLQKIKTANEMRRTATA